MPAAQVRTTIVFPVATAEKLRELVPPRQRSQFVTEAVEARLRELRFLEVSGEAFGAWTDRGHPNLKTGDDVKQYLRGLRDSDEWRMPAKKGR